MNTALSQITEYFDEQIAACGQRNRNLLVDGRRDEATFEKIKSNIYDIFRTVYRVACQTCGEDLPAVKAFFTLRLQQIPAPWRVSYENAKNHNDTEKMHLEQLKLDTVAQIQQDLSKIWEAQA